MRGIGFRFRDGLTGGADQKRRGVKLAGMRAGDKGVQLLDFVDKPVFREEIECAIGHWGLASEPVFREPCEHVIGAERAVFFEQNLKRAFAHRSQLKPRLATGLVRSRDRVFDAMAVIVLMKSDRVRVHDSAP